jgi:hypothetical protein
MRFISRLIALAFSSSPAFADGVAPNYQGLCEASAGAYVNADHFLVASDETNVLRLYKRGASEPVGKVDLQGFIGFDKSDLEGAAKLGERIYWISSHSFNSKGEDKRKRRVFFATTTRVVDGVLKTEGVGKVSDLRDGLAAAAQVPKQELNVEGLAATPDGKLLIGLRAPLRNGNAILVPLENPAEVSAGAQPIWGTSIEVRLEGRGIRSIDLVDGPQPQYVIMAGPKEDSEEAFKLFRWSGRGAATERLGNMPLEGIKPEGMMQIPMTGKWHLASDDGDACNDKDESESAKKFRSIEIDVN